MAIVSNEAHALPDLGHFAWEQTLVVPGTGNKTVVFGNEDGPTTPDSQLYMYVGDKNPAATGIIERNGLSGGKLYALSLDGLSGKGEGDLTSGAKAGSWTEIEGGGDQPDTQIEAAADADGAFGFYRIEDGAVDPDKPGDYYFVTTGSSSDGKNELGRGYRLRFNPQEPLAAPTLSMLYNADTEPGITTAGGSDTAISDNIDVSGDHLMINEDGTTESRAVMATKGRDGSIWRFDVQEDLAAMNASRKRVAELDPPARDGAPVGPGVWETSGILDVSSTFGDDTWLSDVQAHGPTVTQRANTVEDGQLFIMRPGLMNTQF